MKLNNSIYYVTTELRQMVESEFNFVKVIPRFKIFKDPNTSEHWRISIPDKYQPCYLDKIPKDTIW